MLPNRAISGSRWLLAVACSVVLHAALVGGWLGAGPVGRVGSFVDAGLADSPEDDRETIITLWEPTVRRIQVAAPPTPKKVETPATLPGSLQGAGTDTPMPQIIQAGHQSDAGGPSGEAVAAPKLHGRVKPGRTVVYLLDSSSSMGSDLRRASAVIDASMAQLGPDANFQVVAYNSVANSSFERSRPARESNVTQAVAWLNQRVAEGRSDHIRGFREAMAAKPDAIFLLTDADDLDEKEVKIILGFVPPEVFVNAAVFGPVHVGSETTPLGRLTRTRNGSVQTFNSR